MWKMEDDEIYGWHSYGYTDLYTMLAMQEAESRVS